MADLITVSAVIPAFNCAKTLERAVNSLILQSYPVIEIIIVNNNSSDETQLIIEKLHKKNPGLIIPLFEILPGANNARNKGLKIAKGNWIQLLDADDELLENKIKTQVDLIVKNPEADVIYSCSRLAYWDEIGLKFMEYKKLITNDIIKGLITSSAGITSANLWKWNTLKNVGYLNSIQNSAQEYYLMLEIYKGNGKFIADHNFKTIIHISKESLSRSQSPSRSIEIAENIIKLVIKLKEILYHKKIKNYDYLIKKQISKMYFSEYLEHKETMPNELIKLCQRYEITVSLYRRLIIYAHFIYGKYCPKSGLLKYPVFALNFFYRLNKLV